MLRRAPRKGNWNRGSHAESQQSHSLYPPRENGMIERRVTEKYQKVTKEVENLDRPEDGMNEMRHIDQEV